LAAVVALYLLRTALAPSGTLRGLCQMVLDAAPVPEMTGDQQMCGEPLPCPGCQDGDQGASQPVTRFGTKKAAFLSRYRPGRMMTRPQAEPPSAQALGENLAALAVQVAVLRGQVTLINQRLDRAGLRGDLDLAARFEVLAQTVAGALDAAAPRGRAAPCWIGLDRQAYTAQLAELRQWADTVLRQQYGGYELRDCWTGHIHAIWELSTLAAAWHHTYGGKGPDLARALEFYDRWLPGTTRRIAAITRTCVPECVTRRRSW